MLVRISALSLMLFTLAAHGRIPLKSERERKNPRQTTIHKGSQSKESALIKSIQKGDIITVKRLLDAGVSPNSKEDELTPMFFAILRNNPEMVQLLLDRGVNLKAKVDEDRTALSFAALIGHAEIVKLLLTRGADINAEDDCANTALRETTHGTSIKSQVEFFRRRPEWLRTREETSARRGYLTEFGNGHLEIAGLLLARGANVNVKTCAAGDAGTPLWDAAISGNIALVQLLLAHGADPNTVDISFLAQPLVNSEEKIEDGDSESAKGSKLERRMENDWWRSMAPARAQIVEMLKQAATQKAS